MGHGGGLHKRTPGLLSRAYHCVTACGYTVAAIDAPGHGDRPRTAEDEQARAGLQEALAAGETGRVKSISVRYGTSLAQRAVPEWQATLDALQKLPEIGTQAPVGYGGGITLDTAIGIPLTAIEPRITAAIFGAGFVVHESLIEAARRVTVPVQFCSRGTTSTSTANLLSRCSTPSPRRKRRCTPTRAIIAMCTGSGSMTRSWSGISAGPAHHRPDVTGVGVRLRAGRRHRRRIPSIAGPVCTRGARRSRERSRLLGGVRPGLADRAARGCPAGRRGPRRCR